MVEDEKITPNIGKPHFEVYRAGRWTNLQL